MKKSIIMWAAVLTSFAIVAGTPVYAKTKVADTSAVISTSEDIEKVKEVALKHSGIASEDASFIKAKLDSDDGVYEYEIKFISGGIIYDYEISSDKATIVEFSNKYLTKAVYENKTNNYIGVEKAKEIALKHAGLSASEVRLEKAKLDYDNGILTYDVEFKSGHMEYEYEIAADTGIILEYDMDYDD